MRDAGWLAVESPVADGGDGTLDLLLATAGSRARVQAVEVTGPLGRRRRARLGWIGARVAVVELAEAAGLRLLPTGRRDPLGATSRGAGELITAALDGGARRIIVGVGGSASTDGGTGILSALGARILDATGRDLRAGGGDLSGAARLDLSGVDVRLRSCRLEVAVDVHAPLFGPDGAACVFAPQKGADPADVARLDEGLRTFAAVAEEAAGTAGVALLPGAGAAGGCGFALALLGARIVPGASLICDETAFDVALAGAALVITGEGCLDSQTASGKAPGEVARRAAQSGVACVAVCGRIDGGAEMFTAAIALADLGHDPCGHVRSLLRRAGRLAVAAAAAAAHGQP